MYQNVSSDQGWQQLQDRMENLFGHLLKSDTQKIEYKPQFAVPLLEMPSAYNDNERQNNK